MIKISDAEMRVYVQYLVELLEIEQCKNLLETALDENFVSTSSIINISNDISQKYFIDVGLDNAIKALALKEADESLSTMAQFKINYCNMVSKYLEQLSEDDNVLLELRYLKRYTLEKIAELLHSNRQTVWNRLHEILIFH